MTDRLVVEQAHKRFNQTVALAGVDLRLGSGEILALLGPNGAGKTTLVRAIAGRVRLDSGSIELLGERLGAGSGGTTRQRLGVVPQEIALYHVLTARENLEVFGRFQAVPAGELAERIAWALAWTGLEDRAAQQVRTFSGGMKRRLNIACSVLHRPEVLLLDEPTVGVDPQSRQRIWEMLAELRQAGTSLVLTTHQLDEAQQLCNRIVIVDHGKVVDEGTLDQLVERVFGQGQRLEIELDRALPADHPLLAAGRLAGDGLSLAGSIGDLSAELPGILLALDQAGREVRGIRIEPPNLHSVFLHLTGRELRE